MTPAKNKGDAYSADSAAPQCKIVHAGGFIFGGVGYN
jgi:hypothetical protein